MFSEDTQAEDKNFGNCIILSERLKLNKIQPSLKGTERNYNDSTRDNLTLDAPSDVFIVCS